MKIALDAMGGDYAPRATIEGALLAANQHGIHVVLVGDETEIQEHLRRSRFSTHLIEIVHASDSVEMTDKATAQLRSKKNTSLRVALELLKEKKVSAVVSAGHTGAFMATAFVVLKRLPGVERPAITGCFPTLKGSCVVLDLGANVDCKASHLVQFAMMGESYARVVEKKMRPSIGLLSNGEESSKGTELLREVDQILKTKGINYIGFVESKEIFKGMVDVVVCDGFIGNIFLKTCEGLISTTATIIKQDIQKTLFSKVVSLLFFALFKNTIKNLGRRFDYSEYGAAPLLGLNGLLYVCHGRSNSKAIKNALLTAHRSSEENFLEKLSEAFQHSESA